MSLLAELCPNGSGQPLPGRPSTLPGGAAPPPSRVPLRGEGGVAERRASERVQVFVFHGGVDMINPKNGVKPGNF